MSDVRVLIQEVERRAKAQPSNKFDPTYLEDKIDIMKKQVFTRMDRSEVKT